MPAPMYEGLQLQHPLKCYVWGLNYRLNWKHYGYRLLAPPPTIRSRGWEESREQRISRSGVLRTNPGLASTRPGSELVLKLDTTQDALTDGQKIQGQMIVQVEYLKSYTDDMGAVEVTCAGGCTCPPGVRFNAHESNVRSSRHVLSCFPVTPSINCLLRFVTLQDHKTLNATTGHKFVLHAIRVLVQPARTTSTDSLADAGEDQTHVHKRGYGTCDASLPQAMHEYLQMQ
jgi:hypothetical protein